MAGHQHILRFGFWFTSVPIRLLNVSYFSGQPALLTGVKHGYANQNQISNNQSIQAFQYN